MQPLNVLIIALNLLDMVHGSSSSSEEDNECTSTETETITGTIYADNNFRFYFNGEFIADDPVEFIPHQAVEVSFEAPVCGQYTFALFAQDFSDDITGLEYDDNCVGDGGLKAMFSDGTVTNGEWDCKTIMYGPVDPSECILDYDPEYHFTPPQCKSNTNEAEKGRSCRVEYFSYSSGYIDPDFDIDDEDGWDSATEFTDEVVGFGVPPSNCTVQICPSMVDWATYGEEASFIWRPDLNFDNRIICRFTYFREESSEAAKEELSVNDRELHNNDQGNTDYEIHLNFSESSMVQLWVICGIFVLVCVVMFAVYCMEPKK